MRKNDDDNDDNTMRYETIPHDMVQSDTARDEAIRYGTIRYHTKRYDTIQYNTMAIRYDTRQYNIIRIRLDHIEPSATAAPKAKRDTIRMTKPQGAMASNERHRDRKDSKKRHKRMNQGREANPPPRVSMASSRACANLLLAIIMITTTVTIFLVNLLLDACAVRAQLATMKSGRRAS